MSNKGPEASGPEDNDNIVPFPNASKFSKAQANLRAWIGKAKTLPAFPDIIWDDPVWVLGMNDSTVQKRAHKTQARTLAFTDLESSNIHIDADKVPFRQPYADFVKALVRHRASDRDQCVNDHRVCIVACRHLAVALHGESGTYDPTMLVLRHFSLAQESIRLALAPSTAYRVAGKLAEIAKTVDAIGVSNARIGFESTLRRPPSGDKLDAESQKAGLDKMPTARALECLGDISANPFDDNEKILVRLIDLLAVGGFRIGEALTLPVDCWVKESKHTTGKPAFDSVSGAPLSNFGIRYWPEKGGDPIVKWLPTAAVELAKRAIDDLTNLCGPAREVARWLESNPGRLPVFSRLEPDELLPASEFDALLGLKKGSINCSFPDLPKEKGANGDRRVFYRVRDVERTYATRRFDRPILIRVDGKRQLLSENLSVGFVNQFAGAKGTLRFLVAPITLQQIQDALGAGEVRATQIESIFSIRGLMEEDGTPVRIRTHEFRHWLSTLANDGGMSDVDMARWMGRKDVGQNEAYKHGTVAKLAAKAQEMVRNGELLGPLAQVYRSLPPLERSSFLDAAIQAVHKTEHGVCVHNFAADPCKKHLSCLRNCGDFLRTKGDQAERAAILKVKEESERALAVARAAMTDEQYGANNWVRHEENTIQGCDQALAFDSDSTIKDGQLGPVFPSNPTKEE